MTTENKPPEASVDENLKHKFYVMQDSEKTFAVWSNEEYERYIAGAVSVGAGSAFKLVIGFNGDEDYLFPAASLKPGEHDAKGWLKKEGYPIVMPMTLDNLEIILNRYVAQLKSKESEQEGDAVGQYELHDAASDYAKGITTSYNGFVAGVNWQKDHALALLDWMAINHYREVGHDKEMKLAQFAKFEGRVCCSDYYSKEQLYQLYKKKP